MPQPSVTIPQFVDILNEGRNNENICNFNVNCKVYSTGYNDDDNDKDNDNVNNNNGDDDDNGNDNDNNDTATATDDNDNDKNNGDLLWVNLSSLRLLKAKRQSVYVTIEK